MRFFLLFLGIILHSQKLSAESAPLPTAPLYVKSKNRCIKYTVEVADTAHKRAEGLMFRKSLAADNGMIFVHSESLPWPMWMANTLIPLDMVFIDEKGVIQHIRHQVPAQSRSIVRPPQAVRHVLEIPSGSVKNLRIKEGDVVFHASIPEDIPSVCQRALLPSQVSRTGYIPAPKVPAAPTKKPVSSQRVTTKTKA